MEVVEVVVEARFPSPKAEMVVAVVVVVEAVDHGRGLNWVC